MTYAHSERIVQSWMHRIHRASGGRGKGKKMELMDWAENVLLVELTGETRMEELVSFAADETSAVEFVEVRALADLENFFWPDSDIGEPVRVGSTRWIRRVFVVAE